MQNIKSYIYVITTDTHFYFRGTKVIAVASMNMDPIVAQAAEVMLAGKQITKREIM